MNRSKKLLDCLSSITLVWWLSFTVSMAANKLETGGQLAMTQMNCNDLVHVSLDEYCWATITPEAVLEDMIGVNTDYAILVYYPGGSPQPDLIFGHEDIRKVYDYKIWHIASGNSCWGKVLIEDKLPPELDCHSFAIRCGVDPSPENLGLPIPSIFTYAIHLKDTLSDGTIRYKIYDWDQCGYVYLSYSDLTTTNNCDSGCIRKIIRTWKAMDSLGNVNYCNDVICVLRPTVADINYPHHFDGFDLDPLSCDSIFKKLPDGNPHPDFTGWPTPKSCTTLNATFSDLKIAVCGNTYKVLRRWVILDWCSGAVIEYNQVIKVIDDTPPMVECPDDFTMGMQPYSCRSYGKLPAPLSVKDCNNWTYDVYTRVENPIPGLPDIVSKQFIRYDSSLKSFFLVGAPDGRIWIDYKVVDACGNQSNCTMEVGVVDDLVPIPVCDQKTVVSLGADGTAKVYAETFDDGSLDNCGIKSFSVRRMNDTCKSGTDAFGPFVAFCCADVGQVVMVAMQVTDYYGNKNTCMIEATVQDKEPPVIIPPTNITVHCDFPIDFDDLSIFGSVRTREADRKTIIIPDPYYAGKKYEAGIDGWAYDNCVITLVDSFERNIQCNSGTITRKFTATDRQGLVTTAYQTITIINTQPFKRSDIEWPKEVFINTCNNVMTHPDHTGYPKYRNTTCAQIAANYDDLKLAVFDSTCYKILRKWVVIDWCQYNRQTGAGIWDTTQIIVVKSSEPPTIFTCDSKTFCDVLAFYDGNTNQCMGSYSLTGDGEDDCTEVPDLIWSYRIDENNDGTFANPKSGKTASGVLPVGTHRLRWILTDQCGNSSTCDQVFTIKDCKKPTPYCINGIVTVVMQTNGEVSIWAKDFNLGSSDNCTRPQNLKYSFSPDTTHKSITYNCDSLDRQAVITKIVRIYVTDEFGNQDYCETSIRIQDNNHVCPGTNPGFSISGKVRRANQDAMPGTTISILDQSNLNALDSQQSDANGAYSFVDLKFQDFYLAADKKDELTNGVTTLDIVMIQRHILGIKLLDSPYKLLAADVNNSKSLTAKDISDIRRAILGVITEWPNQTPVWKFVKSGKSFADPNQPWDGTDRYDSKEFTDQLDAMDFTGMKTGDIDYSASLFSGMQQTRAQQSYHIAIKQNESNAHEYQLIAGQDFSFDGLQLALLQNGSEWNLTEIKPGVLNIQAGEFLMINRELRISHAAAQSMRINQGDVLFTIVGQAVHRQASPSWELRKGFVNEWYALDQSYQLTLNGLEVSNNMHHEFMVDGVQPNPFNESAILRYYTAGETVVDFKIFDLTGKVLLNRTVRARKGWNQLDIHRSEIPSAGVLYFTLSANQGNASGKMILLER